MIGLAKKTGGRGIGVSQAPYLALPRNTLTPGYAITYNSTPPGWSADADIARVDSPTFVSPTMGGNTVSISIVLPVNYDSSGLNYPVVYNLHGAGTGVNNRYIETVFPARYGQAVRLPVVRPHITVFPNGFNQSMWVNSRDGLMMVEDYFIKEVIPYVHANYRTLGLTRKYHCISGFSMGARAALYYGFKYPELFGACHAYGPPLYDSTADFANTASLDGWAPWVVSSDRRTIGAETQRIYSGIDRALWKIKSPQGYVDRDLSNLAIRLVYGANDPLRDPIGTTFKTLMTTEGITFQTVADLAGVAHAPASYWGNADTDNFFAFLESTFAS